MNTAQKTALIVEVLRHHEALDAEWNKAIAVFGTHDNPLFEKTWGMFDAYVAAISREIGDTGSWLPWFISDGNCGLKGMRATPDADKIPAFPVKTVHDLVALIEGRAP